MQKEISKLLKLLSKEKLKKNHEGCISLYNTIGGLYSENGCYSEAITYHEDELELATKIGDIKASAVAHRLLGECKASMGKFHEALKHISKYVELANVSDDRLEIQRATTTLGRVYLMQAQELRETIPTINDEIKELASLAEKNFNKAMKLATNLKEQLNKDEYAQMQSGLMLNLGLIRDICDDYPEAIIRLTKAMEICKQARIKEDLFRIQMAATGIHRQKHNWKYAVKLSEDAHATAKSIGKKILICEALIEKGFIKLYQYDFKAAKRMFAKAYSENSPNEDDHLRAIKMIKLSHLIYITQKKITESKVSNDDLIKLYDKLGDLFTNVTLYKKAIDCYKRAFTTAKAAYKSNTELSKLIYSIAESYADDGQFKNAITYYEQELIFRNGNAQEQCQTLLKIAHMKEYMDGPAHEVAEAYDVAYKKSLSHKKLMYQVLKEYVPYLKRKDHNRSRFQELNNVLLNLKSTPEIVHDLDEDSLETPIEQDLDDEVPNIEDILSVDEEDEELPARKNGKKLKTNEKGESELHLACISNDLKKAKILIDNGHDISPRDNLGWTPLHEACNMGHYEIVEYLIEKGADPCDRGPGGISPLHDAATNGHWDIMRLLLKNGANVISLTDKGELPIVCLRDYKKRNAKTMSNNDAYECQQMELELLNMMDRYGYNSMEESVKEIVARAQQVNPETNVENNVFEIQPKRVTQIQLPNSVVEYKDAIKTMKRRKSPEEKFGEKIMKVPASQVFVDGKSRIELLEVSDSDDEQEIIVKPKKNNRRLRFSPSPSPSPSPSLSSQPRPQLDTSINQPFSQLTSSNSMPFSEELILSSPNKQLFSPSSEAFLTTNTTSLSPKKKTILPVKQLYTEMCDELKIEQVDYVLKELELFGNQFNTKLDLSNIIIPKDQIDAVFHSLTMRDYKYADFTGSQVFFLTPDVSQKFLEFVTSFDTLSTLRLKCTGMRASHFEYLCSNLRCSSLNHLDISFNNIVYKSEDRFKQFLESLKNRCPALKRVDIGIGDRSSYSNLESHSSYLDSVFGETDLSVISKQFFSNNETSV